MVLQVFQVAWEPETTECLEEGEQMPLHTCKGGKAGKGRKNDQTSKRDFLLLSVGVRARLPQPFFR